MAEAKPKPNSHVKLHEFFVDTDQECLFFIAKKEEIESRIRECDKVTKDLRGSNVLFNVGNGQLKKDRVKAMYFIADRDYDSMDKENFGLVCLPGVFIKKASEILDEKKLNEIIEARVI